MGITVHYRGQINEYDQIDELVSDAAIFAGVYGWRYEIIESGINSPFHNADRENPEQLPEVKGIVIMPDNCEPISLTFEIDGKLCAPFCPPISDKDGLPYVFTKTQYAGPFVHYSLIKLLKCLGEKYFSKLILNDEAEYWEKQDEEFLLHRFGYDPSPIPDYLKMKKRNENNDDSMISEIQIETIYLNDLKGSA
jgi:hypothetical protein